MSKKLKALNEQFNAKEISEDTYIENLKEYIQGITVGEEYENALISIMAKKGQISQSVVQRLQMG